MAWTTPLTAVSGSILTAAQWNASVRDNLNETAPAKATTADRMFVTTGPNALQQNVIPRPSRDFSSDELFGFDNTTYLDGNSQGISVVGVSFTARNSGMALILLQGLIGTNVATNAAYLSFDLREGSVIGSGTQILGPHGDRGIATAEVVNVGQFGRIGAASIWLQTGLTNGDSYNVRCMHVMSPNPHGSIHYRQVVAWPLL